jgi:hypothetical protein
MKLFFLSQKALTKNYQLTTIHQSPHIVQYGEWCSTDLQNLHRVVTKIPQNVNAGTGIYY